MHCNDGPVVLLNLFLQKRKVCDKGNIERFFNQWKNLFWCLFAKILKKRTPQWRTGNRLRERIHLSEILRVLFFCEQEEILVNGEAKIAGCSFAGIFDT